MKHREIAFVAVVCCAACRQLDESTGSSIKGLTVYPATAYVVQGSTLDVFATVDVGMAHVSTDVVWTLHGDGCAGDACGTIAFPDATNPNHARYEAPAVAPDPPQITMTAASTFDPSKTAKARITMGPTPVSLTVDPSAPVQVHAGQRVSYVATVTGDPYQAGVSWAFYDDPWDYDPPCGSNCGYFSSTTTASGQTMTFTVGPASGFSSYPFGITLIASSVTDPASNARLEISVVGP